MSVTLEQRPAAAPTRTASVPPASVWLGFVVVLAASVMDLLDSTIAQTAAPAIRADLGGSYASLEWISAGYTLALAVGLLAGARLGDIHGRWKVMLAGMGAFTVASVLCALAPTSGLLIAARVLQGGVGAIMIPQGFGIIRELFGDEGQQKAFAVFGPVMGLSAVLGPVLGGALVDLDLLGLGWRTIFLVNVPVGVAAIVLGLKHLPRTAPASPGARIDLVSVGMASVGAAAIVYPLIEGRELDWPAWCFAMMAAGIVLLTRFMLRQRRLTGRAPLVDTSILHRRAYVSGLALVLCFIGAMGGMILVLNVMLQAGLGFSPLGSGVATIAIPVAAIFGSITSSVTLERLGRTTIHIGTVTMAIGLVITDLVLRAQGGGAERVGHRRAAGRHRLRHGDDLRADVRRHPRRSRAAPARQRVRPARVGAAARHVAGHRDRRHGAVRRRRPRARPGRLRGGRRHRAAGRRGLPRRRLHGDVVAAAPRAVTGWGACCTTSTAAPCALRPAG